MPRLTTGIAAFPLASLKASRSPEKNRVLSPVWYPIVKFLVLPALGFVHTAAQYNVRKSALGRAEKLTDKLQCVGVNCPYGGGSRESRRGVRPS